MKFSLSVAALALVASQAMAIVPTPVANCIKTVIVKPTDGGCDQFAAANGVTFDQLLQWNTRLSKKCDNLDVDQPICVAVQGGPAPTLQPTAATTPAGPKPTAAPHATTAGAGKPSAPAPAPSVTTAAANGAIHSAGAAPVPTGAAAANKGSLLVAAAGVVLSVAYML